MEYRDSNHTVFRPSPRFDYHFDVWTQIDDVFILTIFENKNQPVSGRDRGWFEIRKEITFHRRGDGLSLAKFPSVEGITQDSPAFTQWGSGQKGQSGRFQNRNGRGIRLNQTIRSEALRIGENSSN
jgi:hypothetical protein